MPRKNRTTPVARGSSKKSRGATETRQIGTGTAGPRDSVRSSILSLLTSGPKTTHELIREGRFSPASLYLNLKQLKNENRVVTDGRGAPIRLAGRSGEAIVLPKQALAVPEARTKQNAVSRLPEEYLSGPLCDALEAVDSRFVAPERIGEKLHTLQELSKSLPSPVSEVLLSIRQDLMRLSPARAMA